VAASLLLLAILASLARADATTTSPLDLVEPARTQALGGAAAAVERDPTCLWVNPASAVGSGRTVTLGGAHGFIEDSTWQFLGAMPAGPATAAVGLAWYDSGLVVLRNADGSARRVTGQRDIVALANGGITFGEAVSAGASVKVLRSDLLDEFHATTIAADLGLIVHPGEDLTLGASLLNAGRRVRYRDEGVPLPVSFRAGGSAATPIEGEGGLSPDRLAGFVDAVWLIRDRRVEWRGGVEADWKGTLAARAGISPSRGDESWRAALGVGVFIGKIRIDYAVQLSGPSTLPQTVSLTVRV
jgi:hypothetical protein